MACIGYMMQLLLPHAQYDEYSAALFSLKMLETTPALFKDVMHQLWSSPQRLRLWSSMKTCNWIPAWLTKSFKSANAICTLLITITIIRLKSKTSIKHMGILKMYVWLAYTSLWQQSHSLKLPPWLENIVWLFMHMWQKLTCNSSSPKLTTQGFKLYSSEINPWSHLTQELTTLLHGFAKSTALIFTRNQTVFQGIPLKP